VIDDLSTGSEKNLRNHEKLHFIKGDVSNPVFIDQLFNTFVFSKIFHLAAVSSVQKSIMEPYNTHQINTNATILLLEAAKKQKNFPRFIFASSAAVYGDGPTLPKHELSEIQPLSPYAIDKYSSEQYLNVYHKLFGIPTVTLRYFNVYGPRQNPFSSYSGVLSKLTHCYRRALKGDRPVFTLYGDGEQTRDFIHVSDVVMANLIVAEDLRAVGKIFNVGTGVPSSLNKIISIYKDITKVSIHVQYEPFRNGDIRHSFANIESLKQLGYTPNYTIEEGLEHYWNSVI
jgi:UDP-glucose 4-epimerase